MVDITMLIYPLKKKKNYDVIPSFVLSLSLLPERGWMVREFSF